MRRYPRMIVGGCDITHAVTKAEWGDSASSLSAYCEMTVVSGLLTEEEKRAVRLYADVTLVSGGDTIFSGIVYDTVAVSGKELRLTCRDRLIFTQSGRDSAYFPEDTPFSVAAAAILRKAGLELTWDADDCLSGRMQLSDMTPSAQLEKLLREYELLSGKKIVLRMEGGKTHVRRAEETCVCRLGKSAILSSEVRRTMDGMVTEVTVLSQDASGDTVSRAVETGDTAYGILRQTVRLDGRTLAAARAEAKRLLAENGSPRETLRLSAIDLSPLRRGDRLELTLGAASGMYRVTSAAHFTGGRMELTAEAI